MDFIEYEQLFLDLLSTTAPVAPYNDPSYLNYLRLNWSRQQRWLKVGILNDELLATIKSISHQQYWTVITEPWCGDSAHTIPFIHLIASINPLIKVNYQLRDEEPFTIDNYLTNGAKSIPKLIIADDKHNDLAVWGPRPIGCQLLYEQLMKDHVDMHAEKIAIQNWYNEDKGVSFQSELLLIENKIISAGLQSEK